MIVKCQHCGKKDTDKTEMEKIKKGYIHLQCIPAYEEQEQKKQQELIELDELYTVIKDIHKIDVVSPVLFKYLQDLRNGTISLNGRTLKKRKQGVRYSVIKEAYVLSRNQIDYAKRNIEFKSINSELMYGFKIVKDKLNDAFTQMQKRKENKKVDKRVEKQAQQQIGDVNVTHKKRNDELDVSDFI